MRASIARVVRWRVSLFTTGSPHEQAGRLEGRCPHDRHTPRGDSVRPGQGQVASEAIPTNAFAVGCGWPVRYGLAVPTHWPSGVYTARFTVGTAQTDLLFIVRPAVPGATARILFQVATTTSQAYSHWPERLGGKSLYDFNSSDQVRAPAVSLERPIEPFARFFYDYEVWFVRWLENVIGDVQLHLHARVALAEAGQRGKQAVVPVRGGEAQPDHPTRRAALVRQLALALGEQPQRAAAGRIIAARGLGRGQAARRAAKQRDPERLLEPRHRAAGRLRRDPQQLRRAAEAAGLEAAAEGLRVGQGAEGGRVFYL